MIELEGVHLRNVVVHKDTHWDQSKPGVYVLRGANRSGKSMVFNALRNLEYAKHPFDQQKNRAKGLIGESKGSITGYYTIGKHHYEIIQSCHSANVTYSIKRDGKDLNVTKKGKNLVNDLINISEEQNDSVVCISAYRPLPLLHGKSNVRSDFFDGLFDLSVTERLQSWLSEHKSKAVASANKIATLEEQKANIPEIDKDPQATQDRFEKLRKKLDKLKDGLDDQRVQHQKLENAVNLLKRRRTEIPASDLPTLAIDTSKQLKKVRRLYETAVQQEREYKEAVRAEKRRDAINAKLETLTTVSYDTYRARIDKLRSRIKHAEAYAEYEIEVERIKNQRKRIKKQLIELNFSGSIDEAKDEIPVLHHRLKELQARVTKLHKINSQGHRCELCEQIIDQKKIKKLQAKLAQEEAELQAQLEGYKLAAKVPQLPEEVEQPGRSLKQYRQELEDTLAQAEQARERERLESELKGLPNVSVSGFKRIKPQRYVRELEHLESLHEDLQKDLEIVSIVGNHARRGLKRTKRIAAEAKQVLDETNQRIAKLSGIVNDLEVLIKTGKNNAKLLSSLDKAIEGESEAAKDVEIYTELTALFGARGLRVKFIESLANEFCANLNNNAHFIYNEQITFKVAVEPSKFDIVARRNGKESDVRYLSGSESRCFQLLCLLALLPFIPAKQRTDYVVLDELESGTDIATRKTYAERFIPELTTIVPKVIVVTPLSSQELKIHNAREFLVAKKNNVSTIREIK